jgi:LPS sulfotransferase NodH
VKRAIILFEGRCGSSHLSSLLDQSPHGTFLGEVLSNVKPQGWAAQKSFMENYFDSSTKTDATEYVGFKTKLRAVDDENLEDFAKFLVDYKISVIRLHRQNLFKQTISSLRADELVRQRGLYNIEKKSDFTLGAIRIGPGALSSRSEFIVREELRIDAFLMKHAEIQPRMTVTYEELLADRNGTLARIFEFMGTSHFFPKEDIYKKMTSDNVADGVSNYEDVVLRAKGCKFFDL